MSETLMPGGGVARRPLHFIVMADCSGSMKGEKMQALNYALRSMLPHLIDWERDQLQAQLLIRILAFASTPVWAVAEPVALAESGVRADGPDQHGSGVSLGRRRPHSGTAGAPRPAPGHPACHGRPAD